MSLAPLLDQLAGSLTHLETRDTQRARFVDGILDLYNDITDWATSTPHSEAALEVLGILEAYARKETPAGVGIIVDPACSMELSPGTTS